VLNEREVVKICDFKPIQLSDTGRAILPFGECKRNIVAKMGELSFCLHRAFKRAPLLHIPLCVRWGFLVVFWHPLKTHR